MSEPGPQPPYPSVPVVRPSGPTVEDPRRRKRTASPKQTALGCVVLIVACAACGFLGHVATTPSARTPGERPSSALSVAQTTATSFPTAPTATATPSGSSPLDGPTLGGNRFNFDSVYGYPTTGGGSSSGAIYDYTTRDGTPVELSIQTAAGSDGNLHVMFIDFGPQSGASGWDLATAQAVAHTYFPPDATAVRTTQASNGPDYVASSKALAATFPASDFTVNGGSQLVPPGTFDYQCFTTNSSGGQIGQCSMSPGHQ